MLIKRMAQIELVQQRLQGDSSIRDANVVFCGNLAMAQGRGE
jgi:hypothetical protein